VLDLDKERDDFPLLSEPLEIDVNKMSLQNAFQTRNSVLELGHVMNVTIFLNETAASGWGSR